MVAWSQLFDDDPELGEFLERVFGAPLGCGKGLVHPPGCLHWHISLV